MHRLTLLTLASLVVAVPLRAEEKSWETFDSSSPKSTSVKSAAQEVYETVLKIFDCWNKHDAEGVLAEYWKSPDLLLISDFDQYNGWQKLHDAWVNDKVNPDWMGFLSPARITVKLLTPNLGLAVVWAKNSFPGSKQEILQNSVLLLQKFEDGWKITVDHTNTHVQ
jgi:hypothetical protein